MPSSNGSWQLSSAKRSRSAATLFNWANFGYRSDGLDMGDAGRILGDEQPTASIPRWLIAVISEISGEFARRRRWLCHRRGLPWGTAVLLGERRRDLVKPPAKASLLGFARLDCHYNEPPRYTADMESKSKVISQSVTRGVQMLTSLMLGAPCTLLALDGIILVRLLIDSGRERSRPGPGMFVAAMCFWVLTLGWLWRVHRPMRWHYSMRDLWAAVTLAALVCGMLAAAYEASAG
jgi:hypothetical protein